MLGRIVLMSAVVLAVGCSKKDEPAAKTETAPATAKAAAKREPADPVAEPSPEPPEPAATSGDLEFPAAGGFGDGMDELEWNAMSHHGFGYQYMAHIDCEPVSDNNVGREIHCGKVQLELTYEEMAKPADLAKVGAEQLAKDGTIVETASYAGGHVYTMQNDVWFDYRSVAYFGDRLILCAARALKEHGAEVGRRAQWLCAKVVELNPSS